MENSRTYLLKAIAGYESNGYSSMGKFHAQHFDDVAKIMNEFAKEVIKEALPLLCEGKSVDIDGLCLQLKRTKRKH